MSVSGSAKQHFSSNSPAARTIELQLNWEPQPWLPAFRDNLKWFLRGDDAPVTLGFRPGVFWKDVFVDQQLNRRALSRSYAGHLIFIGVVYVLSMPFYAHRFQILETAQHDRIVYLNPDEDILPSELPQQELVPRKLAPVISRSSRAPIASKGDSARRPLEAMAIPKWADNTTHTIVAPTAPKILASAPIPDIVLASPVPQAPPVAAVASTNPKLVAPVLEVTPVAPAPDTSRAISSLPAFAQPAPIAPPVQNIARNLDNIKIAALPEAVNPEPKLVVPTSRAIPNLGSVDPVAPAPDLGSVDSAHLAKALPGPAQPVAPPPDAKALPGATGFAGKLPGAADPVGPPPDVSGNGTAASAAGELISLNLNPVAGPPRLPDGSRRGAFAGNPNAGDKGLGIPERQAGGSGPGGDSPVATKDELGIVAAAVPHAMVNGAPIPAAQDLRGNSTGNSLLAMGRAPRLSLPPPRVTPAEETPNPVDERVFRGRKYYTMALNKPNLTSAGGSWIFRFAERAATSKPGEVTAPIPLREVDAAYPADLIRDNVQGVVILYAIIRSDGTVAEVKILEGFDDRLDENARRALSAWHFAPGTRDGNPVDLETVVRIPFRSKRGF